MQGLLPSCFAVADDGDCVDASVGIAEAEGVAEAEDIAAWAVGASDMFDRLHSQNSSVQ